MFCEFEYVMKRLIIAIISMSVLTACSTSPATSAKTVSPMLYSTASSDTAKVTVTRDSGVVGAACAAKIFVDDKIAGQLKPSESVTLHIPSGRHIISFDTRGGLCPSMTDAVDVNLIKDDVKKYRIRSDLNGNYQLLPTL